MKSEANSPQGQSSQGSHEGIRSLGAQHPNMVSEARGDKFEFSIERERGCALSKQEQEEIAGLVAEMIVECLLREFTVS